MSPQHFAAWPPPSPPPYPAPRDRRDPLAWIAPTVATVLLSVLGPTAGLLGLMSVMATDGCGTECPQALTNALTLIYGTLFFGGFLAFRSLARRLGAPLDPPLVGHPRLAGRRLAAAAGLRAAAGVHPPRAVNRPSAQLSASSSSASMIRYA
ncbi:hypothetical protein ACIQ8D_14805 [Streptomyces sp. NPDC096094]|uniref:hypothetical protein n=1 Tax=Streptomyces sp. NPDC096094 TaxID=3366073 RepID=UPI003810D8D0